MVLALGCSSGSSSGGSGGSAGSSATGGSAGASTTSGTGGGTGGNGGATATGGSAGSGTGRGGTAGGGASGHAGGASGAGGLVHATGGATGGTEGPATGGTSGGASGHAGGTSGAAGGHGGGAGGSAGAGGALAGWKLTWSDEFNGADGSAADSSKWIHDTGGNGFGNQEYEYYTDGTQNAVVTGGNLVITAATNTNSAYTCSYPSSGNVCKYTSARLLTKGKFSQKYGRFEARIQIPEGQGIWPAFWMMGVNGQWPSCGEIDVMENVGKEPSINHGSLHMPASGSTSDSQLTGMYTLPGGAKLGDAFHIYAVEWSASAINFYVDDMLYETQTPQTATNRTWEFDQAFYILLNVAVGGQWPGAPDSTTTFPQTMKVDYVRVYTAAP